MLVWILNLVVLDHNDVTCDDSKGGKYWNKEGGEEDEIENVFLENSKRIWGTCGRKTYTLF